MKRRVFGLMASQINVSFGLSQARFYYLRKRQRLWEAAMIPAAIALSAGGMGYWLYRLAASFYATYAGLGQGDLTLLFGVLLCQMVTFVLGFAFVIGSFYYANDLPRLVPLPLRPWEVLAGKLAPLLAGEYAIQFVFLLPVLLAYGRGAGVSPLPFGLVSLAVFLTLPVIPLVLAAIPAMLLMRVLGGARRRDALLVVAGFLFVLLILGGQFYVQSRMFGGEGQSAEFLQRVLATAHGLTDTVGRLFPPSAWAARALSETAGGFAYLLLFAAVSLLALAFFFILGNAVFYQGVLRGSETGKRNRRKPLPARRMRATPPLAGLARAEAKGYARTPVYVLNGFVGFILFPLLFIAPAVLNSSPGLAGFLAGVTSSPEAGAMGALVTAAYFALMTSMTGIPFSPFSREGRRHIWILKSMPIDGPAAARAKIRGSLLMIVPGGLPGAAALEWTMRFPPAGFAAGLAMGLLAAYLICCAGVLIDLARPMLDWVSQEKAVKSNLNIIIGLVLGMGLLGAGFFGVLGLRRLGLPAWAVAAAVGAALAALSLAANRALPRVAGKLWRRLEV